MPNGQLNNNLILLDIFLINGRGVNPMKEIPCGWKMKCFHKDDKFL